MRLGHFLEHLEGPEEVARLRNDGIGFEDLEKAFLVEPWKAGLSIIRVVDPSGSVKPFVELDNVNGKNHSYCPFLRYTELCVKETDNRDGNIEEHHLESFVPGLPPKQTKEASVPKFKPWEKRESGRVLGHYFTWKTPTHKQKKKKTARKDLGKYNDNCSRNSKGKESWNERAIIKSPNAKVKVLQK